MVKKYEGKTHVECVGDLLRFLERDAKEQITKAGYPTDREELGERLIHEMRTRHKFAADRELEQLNHVWTRMKDSLNLLNALHRVRETIHDNGPISDFSAFFALQMYHAGCCSFSVNNPEGRKHEVQGYQSLLGASEGRLKSHGGRDKTEARHAKWQAELDELHARSPKQSWTQLSNRVGEKFTVTGQAVRKVCRNPHKENGN